jgi:tRNA pseudouridine38-40 synthase
MRTLRFTLSYDGTNYSGWQRQANAVAVQGIVEDTLTKICKERITVIGSGRTDAGVHALGQVVSFRTSCRIPADRLAYALNSLLPSDIIAREGQNAPADFNARHSAKEKLYRYIIYNNPIPSPFFRLYAWHIPIQLDFAAMVQAAECFTGTHDFSAFCAAGGAQVNPVRSISFSGWRRLGDMLEYEVSGTGFLYHMVRNMVGTMVDIGKKKLQSDAVPSILAGKQRSMAGVTAPPQGLYLVSVMY